MINHTEVLLKEDSFTRSLNQRRDGLSVHDLGLILLLPSGGDYLQKFSRSMPDLWSLRNLVSELILPLDLSSNSIFIADTGREYISFSSESEAREELNTLQKRIYEVTALPDNLSLLATLYTRQGKIYSQLSEYQNAEKTFEQALNIARETGNKQLEVTVLAELGDIYYYWGNYEKALEYGEKSLGISREIGDKYGEGIALNSIAVVYFELGDSVSAFQKAVKSLQISREIGNKSLECSALNSLAHFPSDNETKLRYLNESLRLSQEIGDKSMEGTALNNLGGLYRKQGDYVNALNYIEQSLRIHREIGNLEGVAIALWNIGDVFLMQGMIESSAAALVESSLILTKIGSSHKETVLETIDIIRTQLGEARFQEIVGKMGG
ncbi:MAG: tetratricopeptide repeat protein [Bacteroidia bacterium]|nr:tetratricopeptide repeat protein [Bacteroidia bacterium]